VRFDAALLAGNGKENLGDAVPDVVSYNILYEEHRQPHTYYRIDEVEPVGTRHREFMCQQMLYLSDEPLQEQAGTSCEDADKKADEQHEVPVGEMPPPPAKEVSYEIPII
jgi:hypothetical protein